MGTVNIGRFANVCIQAGPIVGKVFPLGNHIVLI